MGLLAVILMTVFTVSLNIGEGKTSYDSGSGEEIGKALRHFLSQRFDTDAITKIYDKQNYDTYTGLQILEKIKKNVTKQFKTSEEALRNVRKSALESFYNYRGDNYDFDFLERFRYITHKGKVVSYHQTANFKRKVTIKNSSLVIPLEVYFNWTEVRETILWTAGMDQTFKANWSPNLTGSATMLQYIGTPHGVMRAYPSYYTPREGKWVTYDHRFRIWYAVGAVESKKVVFLMDKSGTLAVRTGKLMREMAVSIIKSTISDDDYISVLTFDEKVEPICCGAQLVRARSRIKNIIIEQIRNIKPDGLANLTAAIRMGIEVLNNSKSLKACHSTLVLFTDYTQRDIVSIFKSYNIDPSVKIVILQVGKDVLFASDLREAAATLNGFHAKIEDLSDINPTILWLTSQLYTTVVDDDDLHAKTTPMYRDASTDGYITTLVVPVVTNRQANWTKPSILRQDKGSFLGVAAVDIGAKSLGQYPLSTARGCYAITVDLKGSVLYHPVLYGTQDSVEIDQKLHLYSYLNNGRTMKRVERDSVFQNFTEQAELLYLDVSDSSASKRNRSFANNYFFNVLVAINESISLLHICNRESLSFPQRTNVQKELVRDILPNNLGIQIDRTRDTAYCSYKHFSFRNFSDAFDNETVADYINRRLQFPECHDFAYEIFDDIYMVSRYLSNYLTTDITMASVTTAAGNRFKVTQENRLRRTNTPYTREKYSRLISLVTSSKNPAMLSVTDVTSGNSKSSMFELSRAIFHKRSDSYPLMLSVRISASKLEKVLDEPTRRMRNEVEGNWCLVDENGFIVATDAKDSQGKHLAKLLPRLMEELLSRGIFNFFNHTECYFSCEDVYPKNTIPVRSAAHSLSRYLCRPSVRVVRNILASTTSVMANLLSHIWFFIFNPSFLVSSAEDSTNTLREDWKSININLTCCHIHPFMSRNFSVRVGEGSSLSQSPTCSQSYRYSAVPDTNLLLVQAWCADSLCTCEGPEYHLDSIKNQVLNPCTEGDENYNPIAHCTHHSDQGRPEFYSNWAGGFSGRIVFLVAAACAYWLLV